MSDINNDDLIMERHLLLLASGMGFSKLRQESYPRGQYDNIQKFKKDGLIEAVSINQNKYSYGSVVEYNLTDTGSDRLNQLSNMLKIPLPTSKYDY